MHALDPYLIAEATSSKYRLDYSLVEDQRAQTARRQPVTCCTCEFPGSKHDKLVQVSNGHWACMAHCLQVGSHKACPHMQAWST